MTLLALILCVVVCGIGILLAAMPSRLINAMRRHTVRALYFASGLRLSLGMALIVAAPESRAPDFIFILGIAVAAKGVIMPLLGHERYRKLIDWFAGKGPAFVRASGMAMFLGGLAIVYALSSG